MSTPAECPPPLMEGQRFFRHYLLKRFLGRGPLGAAWLARHEGMDRDLAMRFLPELWLRDERVLSALREGVVRLLELTHANLVRMFDFLRDEQCAAVVTEFVDGEPLQDLKVQQEQRCFEVEMLRPLVAQLCDVLDYTHRYHDAVHGDLTPANLLITQRGELKVGDFGLVRSLFDVLENEESGTVAGTLAYISPERARGQPCEVPDDIYGFGATLYDLFTSRPPFFRGNIVLQIENAAPPSMAERRAEFGISGQPIPAEWEEVVAACLAKKPEDRPQSIEEVGVRLGVMERHTPRPARPAVPPPPPPGPRIEYPTGVETLSMPSPRPEDATMRAGGGSPSPRPAPMHVGGRIFQRYTLQREIGRGLSSVVWLATDEELQRPVALKLLPDVILHDREAVDELKWEAERALQLDHPHIVRQLDFVHDPHGAAIIMEFVDGEALDTMKAARGGAPWNVSEITGWMTHLCAALDYAHRVGRLVHRDVKPANLLISGQGELKLTGFGTSRSLSDSMTRVSLTSTGGSLAYLSPEQALGAAPSAADDIYAFGATVYELLTGRPPFFRGNLLHQLGTALPPTMAERRAELGHAGEPIPPLWEEVIQACLAKRAQDRPGNMQEVAERLAGRIVEKPDPPAAAATKADAEQSRTTIRKMIASPAADAEPGSVLKPDELRAVIRKIIGPADPVAVERDPSAHGPLAPAELRTVVRKMIAGSATEEQPAAHQMLGPQELRAVIKKLVASGARAEPAERAEPPQGLSPEELRAIIRKMVGTRQVQAPPAALAPEELRAVIRKLISGGAPPAQIPAEQPLGGEELRGVIRKVIAGDDLENTKPASGALDPNELRVVIAKMVTATTASPLAESAGALQPAPEKVASAASAATPAPIPRPPTEPAPAAAKPLEPPEKREEISRPPTPPLPVSAPAAAPAELAAKPAVTPSLPPATPRSSEVAAQRVATLETTEASPPPAPPPPEPKTATSPALETTSPPRKLPEQKPAAPPPPVPPLSPPRAPVPAGTSAPRAAVPPPLPVRSSPAAGVVMPASSPPAGAPPRTREVAAASSESSRSVPARSSKFPIGRRTAWLVSSGVLVAILAGGGLLWMNKARRSVQQPPQLEPRTAAAPTPQPPGATPVPQPAVAERTVTVKELADLAGKGALREPVYLVGDFVTTSSQASTAVLRPAPESSGPLARQVRIVADYPENAVLPREGERVTWTVATRCLIRVVRRGNDGQINVELQVGPKTTG